ncbi:hypothetical protein [Cupriavidus nantongensis]
MEDAQRPGRKAGAAASPGASGEIASAYVARAKADGYTLGIVNVAMIA